MTGIALCLRLPLSSCSPPFLCLSLSLRLAISPCPSCFLSAATGAQLREVADGSSLDTVCVCVHAGPVRVKVVVCACMCAGVYAQQCHWAV